MKTFFKSVIVISIITLISGTLYYLYALSRPNPVAHETAGIKKMDIIKKITVSGRVVTRKTVEVKPQISGIIKELNVEEGCLVKKNDVIAKVRLVPDLTRLNDAQVRLKIARTNVNFAESTYRRVEKRYRGAFMKDGLSRGSKSPNLIKLNRAEIELETARLNYQDAKKDYDRQKSLFDKQIMTVSDFEDAGNLLEKTKKIYHKALSHCEMTKSQVSDTSETELHDAESKLEKAMFELSAAQNNLQLILNGVTDDSPEISNTFIRSTIDGMVLDVLVKEGSSVVEISTQSEGSTIAVVADMNDMIFEGRVDESEIHHLFVGQPMVLTIGAIPNAFFDAIVEHISPRGDEINGAIKFEIRAKVATDPKYFIRVGYSAIAEIVLNSRLDVPAVAEGNLIFTGKDVYAEILTTKNQFERRRVVTGLSDGIHVEIVSGISHQDQIKVLQ